MAYYKPGIDAQHIPYMLHVKKYLPIHLPYIFMPNASNIFQSHGSAGYIYLYMQQIIRVNWSLFSVHLPLLGIEDWTLGSRSVPRGIMWHGFESSGVMHRGYRPWKINGWNSTSWRWMRQMIFLFMFLWFFRWIFRGALPTQTMDYCKGNHSKQPYIFQMCIKFDTPQNCWSNYLMTPYWVGETEDVESKTHLWDGMILTHSPA